MFKLIIIISDAFDDCCINKFSTSIQYNFVQIILKHFCDNKIVSPAVLKLIAIVRRDFNDYTYRGTSCFRGNTFETSISPMYIISLRRDGHKLYRWKILQRHARFAVTITPINSNANIKTPEQQHSESRCSIARTEHNSESNRAADYDALETKLKNRATEVRRNRHSVALLMSSFVWQNLNSNDPVQLPLLR